MERLLVPCDVIELGAGHALVVWTIAPTGTPEERWQIYRKAAGRDDGQNLTSGQCLGSRQDATEEGMTAARGLGLA
jgi:hypothetical protein